MQHFVNGWFGCAPWLLETEPPVANKEIIMRHSLNHKLAMWLAHHFPSSTNHESILAVFNNRKEVIQCRVGSLCCCNLRCEPPG